MLRLVRLVVLALMLCGGPVVELRIGVDVMQTARWHAQLIATVKHVDLWAAVPDNGQMRSNESEPNRRSRSWRARSGQRR